MTLEWLGERVADDSVIYRVGRDGDEFVADWPGVLEVRMRREEERPRILVGEGVEPAFIEKVRKGFLAGLVHHLQGGLAIHASAVCTKREAIVFVGASTAGKSSTAFAVARAVEGVLLADDAALLDWQGETALVRATETTSWLRHDAALQLGVAPQGEKTPATATDGHAAATRVRALVVLRFDDGAPARGVLRRLAGFEAVGALLPSLIRWEISGARGTTELEGISRLCAAAEVFELTRPREIALVSVQISHLLASLPPSK